MKSTLILLASFVAAAPAAAQYYPPAPGYYPPPHDEPRYEPRYDRRYEPRYEVPIGRHCEAFLRSEYGPRRLFCRIVDPKPIGEGCACPPPPPPPGYAPGPFVDGRTVR